MKTKIIKIGNSRGIRIPKPLITQAGIQDEVDISLEENRLVIIPADHPRSDWAEAFRAMAARGDDSLLDNVGAMGTIWDEEEWEWK
ncbi:MAG: AbrB/MazE/SpoVT family DNA-binding domain-containing protein [Candidatus Krumholzibacteriaceae bacterium]|jgi:antitoxin MazE